MNDVIPFAYGNHPVRTLTINGEPWFVLADLTRVLGLRQFRADRLDDALIQNHPILDSLGRTQLREPRVDLNELDAHMSRNLWSKP